MVERAEISGQTPFSKAATADAVLEGVDLAGNTFLITGCASGLGFESMRALTAHGAHVVGLARSLEAAQVAARRSGGAVTPLACDLESLTSIRAAIAAVHALGRPLDAIITNAGIVGGSERKLIHGVERQFFVNHLAHFELVRGLLDVAPDGTGRVVIVSSDASEKQAPREGIRFDDLAASQNYSAFTCYGQSKLATALFAVELSRRLAPRRIAVNALHPGAVRGTQLNRELRFPLSVALRIASWFMKTVAEGAATQVMLAASPLVAGISGQYWSDCQVAQGSKHLQNAALAARLWTVSEALLAS